MRDQFFVLKVLWPIFRYYHNVREDNVTAWWVWPFFSRDGSKERFLALWPLFHQDEKTDKDGKTTTSDWSLLSPLLGHNGLTYGLREAYGFLWELARGVQRSPDDTAVDVVGRVYTHRSRPDGTTASVPFLFNYEEDEAGERTLRLFQFLPIPLGSSSPSSDAPSSDPPGTNPPGRGKQ